MTILVAETLFKNHTKVSEIIALTEQYFNGIPIISVSQPDKIIEKEELGSYYEKLRDVLVSPDSFKDFENTILVIEIENTTNDLIQYLTIQRDIIFVTNSKLENINQDMDLNGEYLRIVTSYENFNDVHNIVKKVIKKRKQSNELMKMACYDKASNLYKEIADILYKIGLFSIARDYYAYAAIAAERTEKWRNISYLWYSAYEPIKDHHDYNDYNTLLHTFPSISFEKWNNFSKKEKQGRALQYAAYSDDNHNGPSDSYWIYEKAAQEYLNADQYGRAIECAVSATNRYATHYHDVKSEMLELWRKLLSNPQKQNYDDLLYISFNDVYRNLNLYKSEAASFFYIEMQKIEQEKLCLKKRYFSYIIDWILAKITNYGTSIAKIIGVTFILVVFVFPAMYFGLCEGTAIINEGLTMELISRFLKYVEISFDIFLGVGSIQEASGFVHIIVILEAFYAYIVLILISTNIIGKLINPNL